MCHHCLSYRSADCSPELESCLGCETVTSRVAAGKSSQRYDGSSITYVTYEATGHRLREIAPSLIIPTSSSSSSSLRRHHTTTPLHFLLLASPSHSLHSHFTLRTPACASYITL